MTQAEGSGKEGSCVSHGRVDMAVRVSSLSFFPLGINLSAVKLYFISGIRDYQLAQAVHQGNFQRNKEAGSFCFILHVVDNEYQF